MGPSPPLQQSGIGVVTPFDFALDRELWRWVPDDITLHITRMPYAPLRANLEMAVHISDPALVAQGYDDVRAVSPLVMAYACTSGSFIGGRGGRTENLTKCGQRARRGGQPHLEPRPARLELRRPASPERS